VPALVFLDLDGTLVRSNLVHVALHHGARRATWVGRAGHVMGLALGAPGLAVLDRVSRSAFQDILFRSFQGLSEDRLRWLGEHAVEHMLMPRMRAGTPDLLDRLRRADLEPVLVTGNLAHVVAPFAKALGIARWYANALEMHRGEATGRLAPPLRTGANKAAIIRAECAEHGVDPEDCHAYSDSFADLPMLSAVGHPCAVHPDVGLREEARANHWPILDLDREAEAHGAFARAEALLEGALSNMVAG
jgi:HAD superfamily hydrolase (TIGR01490 family)